MNDKPPLPSTILFYLGIAFVFITSVIGMSKMAGWMFG
jgi:hypothetical protein